MDRSTLACNLAVIANRHVGVALLKNSLLAQLDRADQLCDTYEQDWLHGRQPNTEAFLSQVPASERHHLLRELVVIREHYLQQQAAGETPGAQETVDQLGSRHTRRTSTHPTKIGRYRIDRLLGQGGFGRVYLTRDERLHRLVAVKVPHAALLSEAENLDAYLSEARTVAHLDHPNIVPVYDVGATGEFPCYIVSKYIDGFDLASRIKTDRPGIHESAGLVATIATALHYAHTQGVVHRDIKPGNILIDGDGMPYVVDFGLALRNKRVDAGPTYLGTPAYMSPEQARGDANRVDACSDIFSLGVVLYELLVGRRPFTGESQAEVLEQITNSEPGPAREANPQIPVQLDLICRKALSKDIGDRYASSQDMADELREFFADQTSQSRIASGRLNPPPTFTSSADDQPDANAGLTSRWSVSRLCTAAGLLVVTVIALTAFYLAANVNPVGRAADRSSPVHVLSERDKALDPPTSAISNAIENEQSIWDLSPSRAAQSPPDVVVPSNTAQVQSRQQAWADFLDVTVERVVDLPGEEELKLVLIPPGTFFMGTAETELASIAETYGQEIGQWYVDRIVAESPQHRVNITQPFWLGKYEITRGQFRQFVRQTGHRTEAERDTRGGYGRIDGQWVQDARFFWEGELGFPQTDQDPAVCLSWNDAVSFCQWLSKREQHLRFSLPTEAEWEYGCRAGTTSMWCADNNGASLDDHAWYGATAGNRLHPVGQLQCNAFGLYDMHGNVFEWCADRYANDSYTHSAQDDPIGVSTGPLRVQRGGDWIYGSAICRSAYRNFGGATDRSISLGFRVAAYYDGELTADQVDSK